VFALVGEIVLISADNDPRMASAPLSAGFGHALVLLLMVTSIATMEFLRRTGPEDTAVWHRLVAPSLAFIGLVMTLWLAMKHISLLVTGEDWVVATMFVVIFGPSFSASCGRAS
jgi:hypothetical protein